MPRPPLPASRAKAWTEAAKTLATFQENPELAVFQLQFVLTEEFLNQKSTLIFDERTPPFSLFSKPADECADKMIEP